MHQNIVDSFLSFVNVTVCIDRLSVDDVLLLDYWALGWGGGCFKRLQ